MFRVTGKYQLLAFGLILMLSMRLMPQGIIGSLRRFQGAPRPIARCPRERCLLGMDSEA